MSAAARSAVSRMLDAGSRGTFDKWLFAQLALARQVIAPGSDPHARLDEVLALLRGLSPRSILENASPFFWLNVIRLHLAPPGGADEVDLALSGLSIAAADGLLRHHPAGASFRPRVPRRAGGYPFPSLGVRLDLDLESRLEHDSRGRIFLDAIEIGAGDDRRRLRRVIDEDPAVSLLCCDDRELFDEGYRRQISPDSPRADRLCSMIREAHDTIAEAAPALHRRIDGLVRWYVPIHSPDLLIHNSFSASILFGVVFLSDAYDSFRLAEAIVHEFHHNELYMLMAVEALFEEVGGEAFYSPWRDDPRPLSGLIHALHVFANVVRFLEQTLSGPRRDPASAAAIRDRAERLVWQLRLGLRQVPRHRLGPGGAAIVEDVRSVVDAHPTRGDGFPVDVVRHARDWRDRNPARAFHGPGGP